jgi:uncharacterized protein
MRWNDLRQSSNIIDRRGVVAGGGGLGVALLALAIYLCGGDPQAFLDRFGGQPQSQAPAANSTAPSNDAQRRFAGAILGTTEDTWNEILPLQARRPYRAPKLVLFSGQVSSACGYASAATGPFYCPGDENLYLDFDFFTELKNEFRAPGDFAQAYVIAHEVGHHVQNILGTMERVQRSGGSNRLSVALELQADCYAGIWANHVQKRGLVEVGDAEEALRAAAAVGDDNIQKRTRGYVVPESFTHGTAQQRMEWFGRGFQTGDMRRCDTFR